jgi:hypothetical protein
MSSAKIEDNSIMERISIEKATFIIERYSVGEIVDYYWFVSRLKDHSRLEDLFNLVNEKLSLAGLRLEIKDAQDMGFILSKIKIQHGGVVLQWRARNIT